MEFYLQVENATKNFGDITLFNNIDFTVNAGDKIALVARNGTGKTTLLNILAGKDTFDSGKYLLNKDIKIGYLEQDPKFADNLDVFGAVYGASGKLMETVRNYEIAVQQHNQKKLDEATAQMDFHQAWDLDARIRQILTILKPGSEDQKLNTLSGGQIKRLALAVTLLNEPDFLILDEPTNHLDVEMVEWLEEYLTKTKITLLMVTHDRYFLDRICNEIIEIDEKLAYSYTGNYQQFLQKRAERILNLAKGAEKAQNLLRTELEWMRRMPKARTTKAKYRIDAFHQLKKQSEYQRNDRQVDINMGTTRLGKKILVMEEVSKRFTDNTILNEFSYTFSKGEKLGIIGKNGAGKTTFLNIVTGDLIADKGSIEQGETVVFGYYRQQGIEYKPGQRVIDVLQDIAEVVTLGDGRQISVSQFLTRFLFPPELQYVPVEKLSGGEKRRLYLMTVLIRNPNFLILDEPTNDFDILTLTVLEEYLLQFNGCVIIVSHDRFFMDKIVDHLFIFEGNGEIYDFPGNYSEYSASVKMQLSKIRAEENEKASKARSLPLAENVDSSKKKLTFKEKQELKELSAEIELLEKEKSSLEIALSTGTLSPAELMRDSQRIALLIDLIDKKTERWFELSE